MGELSYQQTVDRRFVHRYAVSEVFLTDLVPTDRDTCVIGAQLPLWHPYFLDQSGVPHYDALILTECCRQAGTYVAHTQYGVPDDWVFLAASTSIGIDAGKADALEVGALPGELSLRVRSTPVFRGDLLRSVRTFLELSIGSERIGSMEGEGRYLTREEYGLLRQGGRVRPVPLSSSLPAVPAGVPVAPHLVGRGDPRNVLLVDGRVTATGTTARLGVAGRHATIFDHPLDHYPAMALLEAAAQAASLAVRTHGRPDDDVRILSADADFLRFAEVDAPVEIAAEFTRRAPESGRATAELSVSFRQNDAELTVVRVRAEVRDPERAPLARRAVAA
jgi:hypothetical protein